MSAPNRIALALGDPNGIGPEIALKALAAQPAASLSRFTVFGPGDVLQATAERLGMTKLLASVHHTEAGSLDSESARPGEVNAAAGASAVASATAAILATQTGECDAVIACLTLPSFRVALSPTITRPFFAVPRTSVARTA